MADFYFDVDAALSGVPVNLMPLIDDTDFKTIEGAVAYNAAGMALRWHFVTSAGAYTVTSVTPTTAGVHDWTDPGDSGIYTLEIPASGGTINNDTEGYGWFTGVATGVLPWRGPVIGFRAAGLNDLLCDSAYSTTRGLAGTALPNAAAEAAGGLYTRGTGAGQINQAANGQVDANVTHAAGTAWGSGAITAASIATGAIDADALAADAGTEIAAAILAAAADGSYTVAEILRVVMAVLGGQASGLASTTALYKNRDGTKTRITATVDADGNRSSVTYTDLT